MKKIIAIVILSLAVGAQAGSTKKQESSKGLFQMMQRTVVQLGSKGEPIATSREIRLDMKDGRGNFWATPDGFTYNVTDAQGRSQRVNPLLGKQPSSGLDLPDGEYSGTAIESGILPKQTQDGQTVTGMWYVYEVPVTGGMRRERREDWFTIVNIDGKPRMRRHRTLVTSSTIRETVDYWYMESERFHPSLFTIEENPKP